MDTPAGRFALDHERSPRHRVAGVVVSILRIIGVLSLLSAAALIVLGSWASHHWPHRQDRQLFEYMGQRIADGGTVYKDCWDNKPPLVPWINAGVLTLNDSTIAITVAAGLAAGIATIALSLGARVQFGSGVAFVTTLLAAGTFSLRYYDGCTNGTELYAAMFDSVAAALLVVAWKAKTGRAIFLMLLAGVAFSASFGCKQNEVAGPAAMGLVLLISALVGKTNRLWAIGKLVAMTSGFVAGFGFIAVALYRQGALADAYYAVVTSNKLFVTQGLSWWLPGHGVVELLAQQAAPLTPLIWLGALGLLATIIRSVTSQAASEDREYDRSLGIPLTAAFLLWLILAADTVMWGGCHLTRYWHVCFIPLLWLAAQACYLAGQVIAKSTPTGSTIIIATGLTAAWLLVGPVARRQSSDIWSAYYYATQDSELARIQTIASAVAKKTKPEDLIYVWGYEPGVYRFSHRAAPCRFSELCKVEMLGAPASFMVDEVIRDLNRRPPRLIAIRNGDEKPIRAGHWADTDVTRFRELLDKSYTRTQEVAGYILYEQIEASASAPATATSS